MHVPNVNKPVQDRAPTLKGTLSHTPDHTLAAIAAKLDVPIASLATLSVLQSTSTLYTAVLEYVALSDPPEPGTHHPLCVDSFEDRRDDSDISDDDDDEYGGGHRLRDGTVQAGQGLRPRHIPVPRFNLALGETAVTWPPPPHLTAEYLIQQRDQKRKKKGRPLNDVVHDESRPVSEQPSSELTDSTADGLPLNDFVNEQSNAISEKPSIKASDSTADGVEDSKKTRVIYISHYSVGEPNYSEISGMMTYRELLMISADGSQALRDFAKEIVKWRSDKDHVEGDGSKFALYRFKTDTCGSGWWQSEGMKRARPSASVILPEGQMENILNDVRSFLKPETRKWYISHGLPHRRAYLFYGPPGTGKTSTIRAIASAFKLNCCFLSMTTANFSNQCLGDALSQIPENALIVLEDIDALFNEDRKNEQAASLTFSGLLNALDGLTSTEGGCINILTTNFIDKLDKALIRGGRVDRRFLFARPTRAQIKDLFLSFYPDANSDTVRQFLDALQARTEGEEVRSIATLQQLFIDQRESSAEECVRSVPSFFERHFPGGTGGTKGSLYT